ncbi:hypothetical protein UlMin_039043 [Ulmus minor]
MVKMELFIFPLFFFCLLGFTVAGQESIELLNLYTTTPETLQEMSHSSLTLAVSLSDEHLNEVSSNVLKAETWLRTYVLAHYPATPITSIVAGNTFLCRREQDYKLSLLLPSLKNIHHSLKRWGLEMDIKITASFSSSCLQPNSAFCDGDFAQNFVRPLMQFLQSTNSTYSLNPPSKFSPLSAQSSSLVFSHLECMKKLGLLELNKMNVIVSSPKEAKPMSRKLSSWYPTPTFSFSFPSNVAPQAQNPFPPQISSPPLSQIASPPTMSFSSAPEMPPDFDTASPPLAFSMSPSAHPANPPHGFSLPPCNPNFQGAPTPQIGTGHKLWCVAKPNVPEETLQEAMDYACGSGADCEEIKTSGNCYKPDTVVAHASYAFNSYWQKNKRNGGTCSFGGTAMLINHDPSFLHCRFVLA